MDALTTPLFTSPFSVFWYFNFPVCVLRSDKNDLRKQFASNVVRRYVAAHGIEKDKDKDKDGVPYTVL